MSFSLNLGDTAAKNDHSSTPPRMLTYCMALVELFANPDAANAKLMDEKLSALKKTWGCTEHYASRSFSEELLDAIMCKKTRMILNATSVKDIRAIADPPKPRFDGNKWFVSEHAVPEEELILWSITTESSPIIREAYDRIEFLFRQVYGDKANEVLL